MANTGEESSFQDLFAQENVDRGYRFSLTSYLSPDMVRESVVPAEILSFIGNLTLRAEQMIVLKEAGALSVWSEVRVATIIAALNEPERSEKEQKAAAWLDGWSAGLQQANLHLNPRGGPVIDILAIRSRQRHPQPSE